MENNEVIVVGGGIVGCATAREVARRGRQVTLLEEKTIGSGASSASAGILGVQSETAHEATAQLGRESRELYGDLARILPEETGCAVALSRCGTIRVAMDEGEAEAMERDLARLEALGFAPQRLTASEVFRREPAVSRGAVGGALFATDNAVDAAAWTEALAAAARRYGARIECGQRVRRLACEGGRVRGVETDGGRRNADVVVVASGAWSARVAGIDPLPVEPVRGQIVVVKAGERTPSHTIYGDRGYAVPRRDGHVLFGSTQERIGFDLSVTAGGVASVVSSGLELLPDLGQCPVTAMWSGLRPATPDGLPIVGAHPEVANLFVATGHFRNGILLAPVTAKVVADLLDDTRHPLLPLLSPARFGRS